MHATRKQWTALAIIGLLTLNLSAAHMLHDIGFAVGLGFLALFPLRLLAAEIRPKAEVALAGATERA